MKLVIFGLTLSSSWGNGHATLWRGLCKALGCMGHRVVFFERDRPYYAAARDDFSLPDTQLILYSDWASVRARAAATLADADVALVTSYCPDAIEASELIFDTRARAVFYDLDTGVTLANLAVGTPVPYIGLDGLRDYDLVLSYTGGHALPELKRMLGARWVMPLYGHVDTDVYRPTRPVERFRSDLSYLGTYAADRQQTLEQLFIVPARRRQHLRFVMAGAQYPHTFPWTQNVFFVRHLPQSQHPTFFASSRLTLNVTRAAMARCGWCPSGRLFEAAACRTAIVSDAWPGLDDFYSPGEEILLARSTTELLNALDTSDAQLERIAQHAYERTCEEHTSRHRADQLVAMLDALPARHGLSTHSE
jgi:spore maturation protein CgeB